VTRLGMNGPGFHSGQYPDRLWGQPNLLLNGVEFSVPIVQQPEREFDHLAPYTAFLKYEWNYNSTSLCTMHRGGGPLPSVHLFTVECCNLKQVHCNM
jgi:hypothetical protein